MAVRAAVVDISFDLLADWLHLPPGVIVDAVVSGKDFYSFSARLRSTSDFLPEVGDGERFPVGTLTVTKHEPTVEFKAYD